MRNGTYVLGAFIDALAWDAAIGRIAQWAHTRQSRVVCLSNVHVVVAASVDDDLRLAVNGADMAAPDGTPVAWMLRALGHRDQKRLAGPDLMLRYCAAAEQRGQKIFLFGSTPDTLERLQRRLRISYPRLEIAGAISPPFRPLTEDEDSEHVSQINASGAQVVFVGLGCPKQELWMHEHRGRIQAVMIGVGAAFDFHAGVVKRAPAWMQNAGLEWLHRLCSEPRRLWKRYMITNTVFLLRATAQLGQHFASSARQRLFQ